MSLPSILDDERIAAAIEHSLKCGSCGAPATHEQCGGALVCDAIVSRPVARGLDNGTTCEVVRLASDGTTRGAASMTLKACVREAAKRGYTRVVSYTLLGEVGACYRAARWRPVAVTRGGQWDTPTRRRKPAKQPGRKVRWEAGAAAKPRSLAAQRLLEEHAGRVAIPTRTPPQLELGATSRTQWLVEAACERWDMSATAHPPVDLPGDRTPTRALRTSARRPDGRPDPRAACLRLAGRDRDETVVVGVDLSDAVGLPQRDG